MKKSTEKLLLYVFIAIIAASALISIIVFACGMAALASMFLAFMPFMTLAGSSSYQAMIPAQSAAYWAGAQPLGITGANLSASGTLTCNITNNGHETITLREIEMRYLGSASGNRDVLMPRPPIPPGQTFGHMMTNLGTCNPGELKQIMVTFTYDSPDFTNMQQFGARDLAVVCGQ